MITDHHVLQQRKSLKLPVYFNIGVFVLYVPCILYLLIMYYVHVSHNVLSDSDLLLVAELMSNF